MQNGVEMFVTSNTHTEKKSVKFTVKKDDEILFDEFCGEGTRTRTDFTVARELRHS